jgi:hypothetical protein
MSAPLKTDNDKRAEHNMEFHAENMEVRHLVKNFNDAADNYNLARLEYAFSFGGSTPPPALRLPSSDREWTADQRPVTVAVQSVRDYFEAVAEGTVIAATRAESFRRLREASLQLTRCFFQVSLTQLGIPCDGIIDDVRRDP